MAELSWLSVSELTDIIEVSSDAIYKWVKREKINDDYYRYVDGVGRGGKELELLPAGLPDKYQTEYFNYVATQKNPEPNRDEIVLEIYAELKNYQKEHVDLWLNLFERFEGLAGTKLKKALKIFRQENPDLRGFSYPNYRKKKREYDQMGISALAPHWGKREGDSKIEDSDFELFKSYYLKESRPNVQSCWELVRGAAFKAGRDVSDFPHPRTFKRRLKKDVPESAIYMARHGKSAWKRKYANYADRDKSSIPAGSCWVSDHRILDQFVINEKTGKAYRPWLTAWYDFKSGKWLSWFLHEEAPNSDHIFQSFKWAIDEYGKPDHIYIDNGKDYRAKDFAGGTIKHTIDVNEQKDRSMIHQLGITPHFAIPYNAQAKNIERGFRYFIEYLEKHMPGYAGSTAQDRPEDTNQRAKRGAFMHDDTLFEMFDQFIEGKLNRRPSQGKEHKGLSPNELFYKEHTEKAAVRPEALKLFCMRTSNEVTIMRNGALDSSIGHRYYADWMTGRKGEKVYMRRDIKKYQEAWVFSAEDDSFIGKAYMDITINGLAEDDIDRQQLREKQAEKRREKKLTEAYFKNLAEQDPQETLLRSIANEDATEELRKASGDFLDYTEELKINRLADTEADEIIEQERKMQRTGTDDLDEIAPDKDERKPKLKEIWDE